MFKEDVKYDFESAKAHMEFRNVCVFNEYFSELVDKHKYFTVKALDSDGDVTVVTFGEDTTKWHPKDIRQNTTIRVCVESNEFSLFKEYTGGLPEYSVMTISRSKNVGWLVRKTHSTEESCVAFAKSWLQNNQEDEVVIFKGVSRFKSETVTTIKESTY